MNQYSNTSKADKNSPTGCPISKNAANFNPFVGPYQVDPADALRWSREEEPVFYSPEIDYWVITRYDDVKAVFRDNILFSPSIALEKITPAPPEAKKILDSYGYAMDRTMVNEDEPDHMERRRLLQDSFLPEALAKLEPTIRKLTQEHMDRFIDNGKADLVDEIFWEIPLTIALVFLGVQDEDAEQLRKFAVAHTINTWGRPTEDEQLEVAESVGKFWQTANRILNNMRANPSGDGWMYETIRQHEKHPDIVTESYLSSMMMAILVAAHETTANAAANAFRVLLSKRNVWEEICENPALIPNAVEECLRCAGSIVAWRRIATANTRIGDVDIPKNGKLLIVQASANQDPRYFENASEIDIYRDNSSAHLTFGYGAHQCMGKNIARMEMRIFLEEFVKRLPHMRIVVDQNFTYLPNTSFRGPRQLRVEWDPTKNPERTRPSIREEYQKFKIGAPSKSEIARQVEIHKIFLETDDVIRFVLVDPHGRKLPKWSAGSHIDVIAGDIRRKYSLCGDQNNTQSYEISILKKDDGRGGSTYFHENLSPGDMIHIVGPKNHFRIDESADSYLLIAGGIGITPILAVADRLKVLNKNYDLHYCGRSLKTMSLLERVRCNHGDRLFLHPKTEGNIMDMEAVVSNISRGQQIYACGPERLLGMLDCLSVSWPENTLHIEQFSTNTTDLDPDKEHVFEVELKDTALTISVQADETLLYALLAAGVDVPSDCEEGLCGTCEVQVLSGEIDHRDKVLNNTDRMANNRMLTCCSRAKGNKITLAL